MNSDTEGSKVRMTLFVTQTQRETNRKIMYFLVNYTFLSFAVPADAKKSMQNTVCLISVHLHLRLQKATESESSYIKFRLKN